MPTPYISKLAKKHGISIRKAESKWTKAKAAASAAGHDDNFAYVTSVFKSMMHETAYIPTLKDLTNGMSFKYFLVAENDQPQKIRSPEWTHLEKFPQFNELPFKVRRDIEKEVQADGLIQDYEMLEPEEKESVDDHLQDMVIDAMQKHLGTGVNVGDWSSTDHSNEPEEGDLEADLNNLPQPRRKERAPRHIAAMRGPHKELEMPTDDDELPDSDESTDVPTVAPRKTYYKPWSALSDEQRAGRAKLAQKHGRLYRMKQTKAYRLASPEQQQAMVDAIKNGQPLSTG